MSEGRKEIGSVQLTQDMPNGRKMALMFAILDGEDTGSVSARVDGYMHVMERARLKCEIPILEFQLNQKKEQLAQQLEGHNLLLKKQESGAKLHSAEKTRLSDQYKNAIKALKDQVEKGEKEISEKKALIGD